MAHNLAQFITLTQNEQPSCQNLTATSTTKNDNPNSNDGNVNAVPKHSATREILNEAMEQHLQKQQTAKRNQISPSTVSKPYQVSFDEFVSMVRRQLQVSAEKQRSYALEADQKKSLWLEVKERRLTSSQFGSAAEHNTYQSMAQLLAAKLWPKAFNNKFMAYGSKYEAVANYVFQKFLRCNASTLLQLRRADPRTTILTPEQVLTKFVPDNDTLNAFREYENASVNHHQLKQSCVDTSQKNLSIPYDDASTPVTALQIVVSRTPGEEFLGFSPDGVIVENGNYGGLEIKCPSSTKKIPNYIPHAHYDQMQGTMYISGFTFYYYVVYTPEYTLIRKLTYDKHYCETILAPCFHNFFKHYLKALYYKHCGVLKDGEISPAIRL